MAAPQWVRSTGAALAIALSSVPMLAVVPGVVDAHRSLDRELYRQHHATSAVIGSGADTAMAVTEQRTFVNE